MPILLMGAGFVRERENSQPEDLPRLQGMGLVITNPGAISGESPSRQKGSCCEVAPVDLIQRTLEAVNSAFLL